MQAEESLRMVAMAQKCMVLLMDLNLNIYEKSIIKKYLEPLFTFTDYVLIKPRGKRILYPNVTLLASWNTVYRKPI